MAKTRIIGKVKRTMTASVAAIMIAATAASIGASASSQVPPGNNGIAAGTQTAEEFLRDQMKDLSYKNVLSVWQKVQTGSDNAFPEGCDVNGDGEETDEEKNEVADKLREYAAGLTVGLMKMGLNKCCDGLADCFEGPMGDFANAVFGVPQEASNDDVIENMNKTTQQIIQKITDSENRIVNRVSNISVASEYGKTIDNLSAKAASFRRAIRGAVSKGSENEKAVAVASLLGDMLKWTSNPLVDKLDDAREYMTSEYCTTDSENGNNLYGIAFQTALDKGSLFMREAVENSQKYIAQTTNKYMRSCVTLLEMLTSMQKVNELTAEQVAAMSKVAQKDYAAIADHADKAYFYEAEILNDLFGDNGILTKSAGYIDRKNTQPTTYVGRGTGNFVELRKELHVSGDLGFIDPNLKAKSVAGYSNWAWVSGSDTRDLGYSGLTYKEYEGICKHALQTGYTVENYLKANGFTIDGAYKSSYKKLVLPTGHFDDFHGRAFKSYTSYEGFNGFDIGKKYAKTAGSEKFNLIKKHITGLWVKWLDERRVDDNNGFVFFVKAQGYN